MKPGVGRGCGRKRLMGSWRMWGSGRMGRELDVNRAGKLKKGPELKYYLSISSRDAV